MYCVVLLESTIQGGATSVLTIFEALPKELLEVVRDNAVGAQRRPLPPIEYHVMVYRTTDAYPRDAMWLAMWSRPNFWRRDRHTMGQVQRRKRTHHGRRGRLRRMSSHRRFACCAYACSQPRPRPAPRKRDGVRQAPAALGADRAEPGRRRSGHVLLRRVRQALSQQQRP